MKRRALRVEHAQVRVGLGRRLLDEGERAHQLRHARQRLARDREVLDRARACARPSRRRPGCSLRRGSRFPDETTNGSLRASCVVAGPKFSAAIDRGICRSVPRWRTRLSICGARTAPSAARQRLTCIIDSNHRSPHGAAARRADRRPPAPPGCAAAGPACAPRTGLRGAAHRGRRSGRLAPAGPRRHGGDRRHRRDRHLAPWQQPPGVGLRADMDALPIAEQSRAAHASRHAGVHHGCGHDGHTAMLLGAAQQLARTRRFDGTVHFIFQPAEEGRGGARVMVEQGLFERFPCDAVYALHNWPDLPLGHAQTRAGPDHGGGRPLRHRAARPRRPCRAAAPHARRAARGEPARGAAQHHRLAPHRPGRIGGAVRHARERRQQPQRAAGRGHRHRHGAQLRRAGAGPHRGRVARCGRRHGACARRRGRGDVPPLLPGHREQRGGGASSRCRPPRLPA